MKSPLTIFGGKTYMLKHLLSLIPEHRTYVEVFSGAARLFFFKEPSRVEVVNDIHSDIVNFFKVLRDEQKFKQLYFLSKMTPHSREQFYECRSTLEISDDVERAWKFFVIVRQCFSGRIKSPSWGRSVTESTGGMANAVHQWLSAIERLPEAHERLTKVHIEHQDFKKILSAYDRDTTFFYLDPPYIQASRQGKDRYNYELTDEDHKQLVSILLRLEGKILLSGYSHPIYQPLEDAGWTRLDFNKTSFAAARTQQSGLLGAGCITEKQQRIESVWMNYRVDHNKELSI
jgi:DNA adenine methylase